MKEEYKQPTISVLKINPRAAVLTGSPYGRGIDGTGINPEPGKSEDFG